jgi:hypothetical protein
VLQVTAAVALSITAAAAQYEIPAGSQGLWCDLIDVVRHEAFWIIIVANVALLGGAYREKIFWEPLGMGFSEGAFGGISGRCFQGKDGPFGAPRQGYAVQETRPAVEILDSSVTRLALFQRKDRTYDEAKTSVAPRTR